MKTTVEMPAAAVPTRDTQAHKDLLPLDPDDLSGHDTEGHLVLTVDLSRLPISCLAAAGAALDACRMAPGLQITREEGRIQVRKDLTAVELRQRMNQRVAYINQGADAYDRAAAGEVLNAYEALMLRDYIALAGLPVPGATA